MKADFEGFDIFPKVSKGLREEIKKLSTVNPTH